MEAPRYQLPCNAPAASDDDIRSEMLPTITAPPGETPPPAAVTGSRSTSHPPPPSPSPSRPTAEQTHSPSLIPSTSHSPVDCSHALSNNPGPSDADSSSARQVPLAASSCPDSIALGGRSENPLEEGWTATGLAAGATSTSAHCTSDVALGDPPAVSDPLAGEDTCEDAVPEVPTALEHVDGRPQTPMQESALSNSNIEQPTTPELVLKRPSPSFIEGRSIAGRSYASNMSPEDEVMSLKVRSMYDCAGAILSDSSSQVSSEGGPRRISRISEEGHLARSHRNSWRNSYPGAAGSGSASTGRQGGSLEDLRVAAAKEVAERPRSMYAGGAEDWEDLEGSEVDRYGFIDSPYIRSTAPAPPNPKIAPKRVATALFLQSQEPRRRTLKQLRLSPSAPEMLRSPANPKQIREKEDLRARKWRQMAIVRTLPDGSHEAGKGGGVEWDFPVKDPKLIRRTWKGIPDCWRGAAWHAFLTASSKARKIGQTDGELVAVYHELLSYPSSDDVQIDLDVPRTISSHVMFRQRYRGGQRLLFRVLHSLALYFPDTGYVQGMASLAATLLCYYDEETAFIMLVRLWQLRGLEKLYESGFGGLMTALEEFEAKWMKNTVIQKKLNHLNINATAYGTRWYLTLFNYSIPFAAQLRIWDVFMLLGDPSPSSPSNSSPSTSTTSDNPSAHGSFNGTLDIMHATSAAILDGMKSIILKADFEEAMKNLTSFVPVKDEDMLMRVVKSEWKQRRKRW